MTNSITLLISSGDGPAECRQAVAHILHLFSCEAQELGLQIDIAKEDNSHEPKSAIICLHGNKVREIADQWLGTIQWTCKSNLRPKHKRQNWFVGIFEMPRLMVGEALDKKAVRFESFRAGGPGGQHQNTTDSAVRAICKKTGICVVARDGRSQHRNKSIAIGRLRELLAARNSLQEDAQRQKMNMLHHQLERGNPVRRFKGRNFKEVLR